MTSQQNPKNLTQPYVVILLYPFTSGRQPARRRLALRMGENVVFRQEVLFRVRPSRMSCSLDKNRQHGLFRGSITTGMSILRNEKVQHATQSFRVLAALQRTKPPF